jgi:hypothetical protein
VSRTPKKGPVAQVKKGSSRRSSEMPVARRAAGRALV